jgi:hypothetical protein
LRFLFELASNSVIGIPNCRGFISPRRTAFVHEAAQKLKRFLHCL